MRQRALTRRAVLRGTATGAVVGAVAVTGGCSAREAHAPGRPNPDTVLLTTVIADKEQMVELYRRAARSGGDPATMLRPFQQRHEAHLAELRRRLPPPTPGLTAPTGSAPSAGPHPSTGSPASSGPATPAPTAGEVAIGTLRDLERRAAATRPHQIGSASPALAQLLASIGACEAAHAVALAKAP